MSMDGFNARVEASAEARLEARRQRIKEAAAEAYLALRRFHEVYDDASEVIYAAQDMLDGLRK